MITEKHRNDRRGGNPSLAASVIMLREGARFDDYPVIRVSTTFRWWQNSPAKTAMVHEANGSLPPTSKRAPRRSPTLTWDGREA